MRIPTIIITLKKRGKRPYRGQSTSQSFRGQNPCGRGQLNQNTHQGHYQTPIIKAITTKVIKVSTIIHIEAITKVIVIASIEAEAMDMPEVIIMAMAMASQIIKVITINNLPSVLWS